MITRDQLASLNPWWSHPDWASSDIHLAEARGAPFIWDPAPFSTDDLRTGAIYTLRGPRQSGKTTLLKRLIARHLETGRSDRTAYLTLQPIASADELTLAIELTLRTFAGSDDPWLFVLDEVTFVEGWARALMFLRDSNPQFRQSTVIVTGSSAVDLAMSASVLAGRRGRSTGSLDRLHLPMSFREFLFVRDPALVTADRIDVRELRTVDAAAILKAALHTEAIDDRLTEFTRTGGLPRAIADLLTAGAVQPSTLDEVWRLVLSDVVRLGRSDATAQKLLARLVVGLGSPMSWPDLAGEMGVTGQTAEAYTDVLARAFVVLVLHQADLKRQGGPSLRRRRKLYVVDPLTARLPGHLGGPTAALPQLVENVIGAELFRRVEQPAVERFAVPSSLFLWRSANDREVDFVVHLDADLAIESKYARSISGKDRESLVKAFGGGIIASRTTVETEGSVRVIPAGVLLSLLAS